MADEKNEKSREKIKEDVLEKLSEELRVEKKPEEIEVEKPAEEAKPAEVPKPTELASGVFSYGKITVGENGQVFLPKEALEHFEIKTGDKLMVIGDVKKGIGIVKSDAMKDLFMRVMGILREVEKKVEGG